MTTVDIEALLVVEEIRQLLEAAEQAGVARAFELAELAATHELNALEQDALLRELEKRGIEIVEAPQPEPPPPPPVVEMTTDALQLFLREAGKHQLLTAAQEVGSRNASSAAIPMRSSG